MTKVLGTADDLPCSGRPRVTTPVQDRHIRTSHLNYHFLPATLIAVVIPCHQNDRISAETVRNRFADYGIRTRNPYHIVHFDAPTLQYRTSCAYQRICCTQSQWNTVLFRDASRFCLDRRDGRMGCYHRRGERYSDVCILESDRSRRLSVMVWTAISFHVHSELIRVQGSLKGHRYRDEI